MSEWPGAQESEQQQWPGTAEPQEQWPGAAMTDADREIAKVNPRVEGIMSAFGHGAAEGWGPERLGLSDESNKWLQDKGVLPKPGEFNVLKSINDMIIRPAAATLDAVGRLPSVYHGAVGEAATAAGLPSDVAGILSGEYFSGNLRAPLLNIERPQLAEPKPFVRPVDVKPVEGSPNPGIPRTNAAMTGDPLIDAILRHPTMRQVINNPVVDDSHTVPNSWGGSEPINNPTVYRDYEFPKSLTVDGKTIDTADPAAVHENVEQFAMKAMTEGGMDTATALKVGFWEFGEKAEDAFYRAHGMDPEKVEAALAPYVDRIAARTPPEEALFHGSHTAGLQTLRAGSHIGTKQAAFDRLERVLEQSNEHRFPGMAKGGEERPTLYRTGFQPKNVLPFAETDWSHPAVVAHDLYHEGFITKDEHDQIVRDNDFVKVLARKGYDAISYTNQHEDIGSKSYVILHDINLDADVPADLFRDTYPDGDPRKAAPGPIDKPTPEEVAQGRAIVQKYLEDNPPKTLDLNEARDLGVIGPERKPITEGPAADAAARTVAADRAPDAKVTQEVGGGNPWQQRFEQFVSKLEAPEDVKQLIRDAAKENDDFLPARQGDIPLRHVEDIAQAAGVDPGEINQRGLGRTLRNDAEVRIAMQLMLQATENVKAAARDVKAGGSADSMIKLQEAIMRRDLAVEQVVGLRAEWGRTGNVIQEFLRDVKDQEGLNGFLKGRGRSPKDLRDLADALDTLDGAQAAKMLNDARKPDWFDKFMWYWTNALISGPTTHAKYVVANAAFAGYESAVVTPIAGAIGTARRLIGGDREGVFIGEAPARLWGILAGTPDALVAAVKAARTGMQTPLPGEIAQNILPKQNKNVAFQQKPIGGAIGTAIGLPSRGAAAIHSFFNFLGYRASIEAQAYRAAAKEGLNPTDDAFWQRREAAVANPDAETMNSAIEEGYRLTYLTELGPIGKGASALLHQSRVGRLVLPFTHIPFNILSRGIDGTPAAFLSADARADLFGKNGAVKQDMATARLVAGSAVGAWAANLVLNDRMTGYGPTDPTERSDWLATGHQPYSIRIGDYWHSFNRFGSLGTMLGLYANLGEAMPHIKRDAEELTKALTMTVHATGRLMEDEVGMQGLAGLMEAIDEPERKGTRFVSNFAGSMLPYSSALRQTASAIDPYMRETKSVVDGLRYYIPVARQGLLPKRDWLGEPLANAGYGFDIPGAPMLSSIIQHRQVNNDPVNLEMQLLGLHAAPPQDRIGGVKLTPQLYDQYQAMAGPMTRAALEQLVSHPGWHEMPAWVRADTFRSTIAATRSSARAAMQAAHPEIVQQGVDNARNRIEGNKPTKLRQAP